MQRIYWSCSASDKAACDLKGKGPEDCQNYIRVLSVISPSRLLVCGTNCYNPLCRHYQLDPAGYYSKELPRNINGKVCVRLRLCAHGYVAQNFPAMDVTGRSSR